MRKKWWRQLGAVGLSVALAVGCCPGGACMKDAKEAQAADTVSEITVNGNDIQTENQNGLTFKGFGILSGNSTSDLLMDYKAENPEAYAQMMQLLFGGEYPIMNHVKLEMGDDRNTSTGAEACTKRSKDEKANVRRNPGWQLAADAKKINPDVKVSILKWCAPKWAAGSEGIYQWYKESILDAYETYGFMVDYINPNTNESWSKWDIENTKKFAKWIAEEDEKSIPDETARKLFQQIKLVISDEAGTVSDSVAEALKTDQEFFDAVDVVGYHYSPQDDKNGGMKWFAEQKDKEVWNSEAQATFSNSAFRPANNVKDPTVEGTGIGGGGSALEMGNTFIKGLVLSRRSHVIYQPGIGSFYEGAQYSYKELLSARDPWSGWIHYDAGLLVLSHVSKFAVTGWENEDNTAGIWRAVMSACESTAEGDNPVNGRNGGPNYMTLAAPAKDNFSTVIVNDSEKTMNYKLKTENMKLAENQELGLWETRAADDGSFNENYMKFRGNITKGEDGSYSVQVKPFSIVTVTTLNVSESEEHTAGLPVEGERTVLDTDATGAVQDTASDYLYADDFEYTGKTVPVLDGKGGFTGETEDYIASRGGDTGAIARYTHNLNGSFETYKTESGNHVLRQQLDKEEYGLPSAWNSGDPVALIGDFRWLNYSASVDAMVEKESTDSYVSLGIRQIGGDHRLPKTAGYSLRVYTDGRWEMYRQNDCVLVGILKAEDGYKAGYGEWNNLRLEGAGNEIRAYVNDTYLGEYVDETPITAGRIALGSANVFTQFDNLTVKKLDGYAPYYAELLDNMEKYDLSPEKKEKLVYGGDWLHTNGQGMMVYQRSASFSQAAGANVTYTFTGTGLEILGVNDGKGKLKVTVDGTVIAEDVNVWKTKDYGTAFSLTGLYNKEHTVTVEVTEGSLTVDMVGVIGNDGVDREDSLAGALVKPVRTALPLESVRPFPPTTPEPVPTEETPAQTDVPAVPTPSAPSAPQGTSAAPAPTQAPPATQSGISTVLKDGDEVASANAEYIITDADGLKAAYKAPVKKNAANVTIPATVTISRNGESVSYKVTSIAAGAFAGNKKLKSVTVGKNIQSIGKNAFKGCSSLKQIRLKTSVLKKVGAGAVKNIAKKAVISCPAKKVKAYKKLFTAKTGFQKKMKIKKNG